MREKEPQGTGIEQRLLSVEEMRDYTGLGRNGCLEMAKAAGARIKVGKRVLFDKKKIDEYLDHISE